MENHLQRNSTNQMPQKHNWSKFNPQRKELNDEFTLDLPSNNAELLKSKFFHKNDKYEATPSEHVRISLNSCANKNFVRQALMEYFDMEVKDACDYIDKHPGKCYRSQFTLFKIAAEYEHPAGQYYLGNCYLRGYGCEISEEKAAEWHSRARLNGYDPEHTLKNQTKSNPEEGCFII